MRFAPWWYITAALVIGYGLAHGIEWARWKGSQWWRALAERKWHQLQVLRGLSPRRWVATRQSRRHAQRDYVQRQHDERMAHRFCPTCKQNWPEPTPRRRERRQSVRAFGRMLRGAARKAVGTQ